MHTVHTSTDSIRISTHLQFVTEAAKTCKNTAALVIYRGRGVCLDVCLTQRYTCTLAHVHVYM